MSAPASTGARWVWTPARMRDRLLGSAAFRRWAIGFPLTRPIAQRRARALFDVCAGFVYAQVLYACVRLDLFAMLAEGPQSPTALARRMGLSLPAAERLLAAAAALKLAARRGERFGLGKLGAAMVADPGLAAMVSHHALFYADLQDPVALLRGEARPDGLAKYWPYAGAASPAALSDAQVAAYTTLMAASQPMIAEAVLHAYPLGKHRQLMDIGGGDGSFAALAAARAPGLDVVVFDLPPVAERARARLAAAGLSSRATAIGGNFLADDLPHGADVVTLIRVIHDHDDDASLAILQRVHVALPTGGVLVLAEPMAGTPGAEPIGEAYFGFYLLAMGSGRPRTPREIARLLAKAGFQQSRQVRTRMPLLTSLIVATKASKPPSM
jgi:demethylspheroidene O-methyltransferase